MNLITKQTLITGKNKKKEEKKEVNVQQTLMTETLKTSIYSKHLLTPSVKCQIILHKHQNLHLVSSLLLFAIYTQ